MQTPTNRLLLPAILLLTLLVTACTATISPVTPTVVPPMNPATVPALSMAPIPAETLDTIMMEIAAAEPDVEYAPMAAPSCAPDVPTTQSFMDVTKLFCFHLPAGFTAARPSPGSNLVVYAPASTPGHRERAFVEVEMALGRTADTAADAVVAALTPGFTPTRSTVMLNQIPAVLLDGLPGQDIQRKLFAVADDRLYTLTFVPATADPPQAFDEMETLYALILNSFDSLPEQAVLAWLGDIQGKCHILMITATGNAGAGRCNGDSQPATATLSPGNGEWDAILAHFGPIDAHADAGHIVFTGNGAATGQEWDEALATWAGLTAQEMIAGRASASVRTVLAWQLAELPDQPGQCRHLIVLAYGYAYANVVPCGGGQTTQIATGWLTDDELATLATWRMESARVDGPAGYVDATGTAPLAAADVATWAASVYDRLAQ